MSEHSEIVIVSGLPRSGTSLMMQMLAAGGIEPLTDEIRQADTDNPKGYYEFERAKKIKDDTAWLVNSRGKAVKMISQLLYDLPMTERYKIIFMCRDLDEVVQSQEKMLIRRGHSTPDRRAIKTAFNSHLEKLFKWLTTQPSIDLIKINYKDLITDSEPLTRRIATFLSQPLNTNGMLAAIDPALYRNRE